VFRGAWGPCGGQAPIDPDFVKFLVDDIEVPNLESSRMTLTAKKRPSASPDPLEEQGGSFNLYSYVNENPLTHYDPDGAEVKITYKESGLKLKGVYHKFGGKKGTVSWSTSVTIEAIEDPSTLKKDDPRHVFRIVEETKDENDRKTARRSPMIRST